MTEHQLSIFDWKPPIPPILFKGETVNIVFDAARLNRQMRRVHEVMIDGIWRTLREIEAQTGDGQASISARLRDYSSNEYLRQRFIKERRRRGDPKLGIHEYRVTARGP